MNPDEYSRLAQQHRPLLAKIALRFFSDAEAAEDIVQDTLLRLWLVRERMADANDFCALGTRIAKNLCVNEWKRRQIRNETEPPPDTTPAPCSTDEAVEMSENKRLLQWAVSRLPHSEQRIFRLWSEERLGVRQIADVLGIKPTTVSNTLSKVKRKLLHLIRSQS